MWYNNDDDYHSNDFWTYESGDEEGTVIEKRSKRRTDTFITLCDPDFDDGWSKDECQYCRYTEEFSGKPCFRFTCTGAFPLCNLHSKVKRARHIQFLIKVGVSSDNIRLVCKATRLQWIDDHKIIEDGV